MARKTSKRWVEEVEKVTQADIPQWPAHVRPSDAVELRATITQQAQEMDMLEKEAVSYKRVIESNQKEFSKLEQQLAASQARVKELEDRVYCINCEKITASTCIPCSTQKWAQLQATLAAREARIRELEDWQNIVLGSGTDQETVIRMAANEYTKTAVQCWKDHTKKIEAERDAAAQEAERLREALDEFFHYGYDRNKCDKALKGQH